ncbi:hypothetical protein BCR34DRAFT_320654 [Clohesyomyces aquaticus]|uniref:DUF7730 domain-containing protein n=1 Tax=Clohesyomyces aquaticus TaxID=1231657 RepID=A0A1Y2A927_9PLEO|nr:hypothetical protein BCR34DRAFT_320654 [Clohesyomyces aquaticus]
MSSKSVDKASVAIAIISSPVWSPIYGMWLLYDKALMPMYQDAKSSIQEWERYRLWKRRREFPILNVKEKRRSLSVDAPIRRTIDSNTSENERKEPDLEPRLLRLPPEIRMMIWEEVLGKMNIHIEVKDRRIGATICQNPVPEDQVWRKMCPCRIGKRIVACTFEWEEYPPEGLRALPLLLTCRPIYRDVLDHIYRTSTFLFHRPEAVLLFVQSIPPTHAQRIAKIHLDARVIQKDTSFEHPLAYMPVSIRDTYKSAYPTHCTAQTTDMSRGEPQPSMWGAMSKLLSSLGGLRELRISLHGRCFPRQIYSSREGSEYVPWTLACGRGEKLVLEPLKEVARANLNMVVNVDWYASGTGEEDQSLGYVLKRPER